MTDKEKDNRVNALAMTFLEELQIRPHLFADQILRAYKAGYYQSEKDSLLEESKKEQPEYSFIESTYRCGKKPRWNIGDTLAYYEFTSDCEGERVLGKITDVELDEDIEDWVYIFEDGYRCDEESLLSDETYKKN